MPRGPRLDAPGIVHHVIARGIEGRKIFRTDDDREGFLERLQTVTKSDSAFVYSWALIPNHFHLAIRTGRNTLSSIMRRLMTGYAVAFNKRYSRQGHLFQNRYKSIVVDEESYLLALVRYIHLNPLRAGLVRTLKELNRYPWSGHSALMGFEDRPFQDTDEILGRFGQQLGSARKQLLGFMSDKDSAKKEQDLFKGGGLVRSAGGIEQLQRMPKDERQMYDERILGDGQFVKAILEKSDTLTQSIASGEPKRTKQYEALQTEVCRRLKISSRSLSSGSRIKQQVIARIIVAYLAGRYLGWSGKELASKLGISPGTVSRSITKGEELIKKLGWDVNTLIE